MLIMMLEKPMFDLLMLTAMMNTFLMFIAKAIEKMMSFITRRLVLFSTWMSPISAKVEGEARLERLRARRVESIEIRLT